MKKGKVALIGTGFVGMSMAYAMLNRGGISELVLIDIDKDKIKGEEMDLSHGLAFAPSKMVIKAGDYADCKDAQVAVITAGVAQKPGQTRLELAEINARIIKDVVKKLMMSGFNGIIVMASNPVDLMTYVAAEVSGLPKNQVFGTGTVLDTARLRYMIGEYLNVATKNIHAYILGEHGDSSFVLWKYAMVGCKGIIDVMKDNHHSMKKLNELHQEVVNAAYEIIQKKTAASYISALVLYIFFAEEVPLYNLKASTYLDNQYGENDVFIGVPAIINSNGVREIVELELTKEEQEKLDNSCNIMKEMRKKSIDKIVKE